MIDKIIGEGITFDDVLLVVRKSDVVPSEVSTATRLTRTIELKIPIVSAPMDTVTESELAIALAQEGGLGVIHKNLSIEAQCREVEKVKRSANGVITDPVTLAPDATCGRVRELMDEFNISGVPIVDGQRLVGIVTRRDLGYGGDPERPVSDIMTADPLVTAPPDTDIESAIRILQENKVEKLLLVRDDRSLAGLITRKDIDKMIRFPNASRDERGRLRVGAAVGVHDYERIEALIAEELDVIVVDTAHGHTANVIETVSDIKKKFDIDVIAGNIATAEAAEDLARAGADAVKVGIGPGSICTTRIISGVGVPQITAIANAVEGARKHGIPVIADGGIRQSGDITKAIAAGADTVMLGGLFAGLAESPGEIILYKGRSFKRYRGMGSLGAMVTGSADRYGQKGARAGKLVPEGVEGRVPYRGPLSDFVYQMVGGLRAGMGYLGASDIATLQREARFIRVSSASNVESHPHNIVITQEAPNYSLDVVEEY